MRTTLFILLVALLTVSCVKTEEAQDETVTIDSEFRFENFPHEIESLIANRSYSIADFKAEAGNSYINISFSYKKLENIEKLEIIAYFSTEKKLLLVSHDSESRHTIVNPPGPNGDNVALTLTGYKNESTGENAGTFTFSIPDSMWGLYDIDGDKGTVTVFLSDANSPYTSEELYRAISNILTGEF